MSKGKVNAKNNNKISKVPVKVQPMKQQKPLVNKNIKEIKASQVSNINKSTKTAPKSVVPVKKENNVVKAKNNKKIDISESCDDEDDSDIEFSEVGSDSDIDDVDLEDDDDMDDDDLDDDDEDDDDDDDINYEELVNSDNESMEDAELEKLIMKSEMKVKNDKKQEKKPEVKEIKIDESSPNGKILVEMNKRKNMLSECITYINNLSPNTTRQVLFELLEKIVKVISINVPGKSKGKKIVVRGYGFIRCANPEDSKKVMEFLNDKEIDGNKISANKFVCKKILNDVNKINLKAISVTSFKNVDITQILESHFKVPVTKIMDTVYEMKFSTEKEALVFFNKEKINVKGHDLLLNFVYKNQKEESNEKPKETKEPAPVKTGMKRSLETVEEPVEKKAKINKVDNKETKEIENIQKKVEIKEPIAVNKKVNEKKNVKENSGNKGQINKNLAVNKKGAIGNKKTANKK